MPISSHLNVLSSLLPLGVGLYYWPRISSAMRLLLGLLGVGLVITMLQYYFAYRNTNNMFLHHLFTIILYPAAAWILSLWSRERAVAFIRWSIVIFLGWYLFSVISGLEELIKPPKYSLTITGVLLAMISMHITYITASDEHSTIPTYKKSRFWVAMGMFINYSGNVFVFASIPVFITIELWDLLDIAVTLGNLLYLVGFVVASQGASKGMGSG